MPPKNELREWVLFFWAVLGLVVIYVVARVVILGIFYLIDHS